MGEKVKLTESAAAHLEARLTNLGRDLSKPADVWDHELQGLVLRREPSGRKFWYMRIHVNGRRSGVKLGEWPTLSVTKARKAAKAATGAVATGSDPVKERQAKRMAAAALKAQAKKGAAAVLGTFIEGDYKKWAEAHLRTHAATLASLKADFGNGDVRKGGKQGKGSRKKTGAGWWSRPMESLTVMDVERWRREQLKAGSQKSTVNRAWQRLRAVLGKAHEWGLIGQPPKVKRFRLDNRGRVRYLSQEERARLLAALDDREQRRREERARMNEWLRERHEAVRPKHGTYTDHLKPLVLVVLNTGLRRGEALGLKWAAINFARDMVHVEAATSKSGQSRDVPMTAEARKVLDALHDQQRPAGAKHPDPAAHLFGLADGTRLRSVGVKTWDALMVAAKVKDFRFHDLRHDYASRLVTAGVDLYSVSKLLGHSDVAMSQRYAHLSPDYLRAAILKLDQAAA